MLPSPFLPHRDAFRAWGFDLPTVDCAMTGEDDEALREFLLYAQARCRTGARWTITGVYQDPAERHRLTFLRVEFEAHPNEEMHVEYVVPVAAGGAALFSHAEGAGLLWLDLLRDGCAFCPTMAEALRAIEAFAQGV